MKPVQCQGVFCALWTPANSDGTIAFSALDRQVEFVQNSGVAGFVALGSTGEFPFFDLEERRRILERIVELAGGLPVIANISDIRPGSVRRLGKEAREAGASAVAVLPPWFYPVAQSDLVEFFTQTAESAELPLVVYNFPERTGNPIAIETIALVADRVRVLGVKQSGHPFEYHRELSGLAREKGFALFTGSDVRLRDALELGANGCVSGLANAVPELVLRVYAARESGESCDESVARLQALGQWMDQLEFPLNVAAAIEARGLDPGAPKRPRSRETEQRYRRLVDRVRESLRGWGLEPIP